jgi:hypothetical protein
MDASVTVANLIIAGVNRAGTTSLFTYLAQHPRICPSSVKETCYFLPLRYAQELEPIGEYARFFNRCGEADFYLEATPGYFYGGRTIANAIKSMISSPRLIVVFRNPVDRLISVYRYHHSRLNIAGSMTIDDYVDKCRSIDEADMLRPENKYYWGLRGGRYSEFLSDWLSCFSTKDLRFYFFDDLASDPAGFTRGIVEWLGLDYASMPDTFASVENRGVAHRFASLQRLAVWVNDRLEPFWRSNPTLKRRVRRAYQRLNAYDSTPELSVENEYFVADYFAKPNEDLRSMLLSRGYERFPDWLC